MIETKIFTHTRLSKTSLYSEPSVVSTLTNNNDLLALAILDDSTDKIYWLSTGQRYKCESNVEKQTFDYDEIQADKCRIAYGLSTLIYKLDEHHDGDCVLQSCTCCLCSAIDHCENANYILTQFKDLQSNLTIIDLIAAILHYEKCILQWEYCLLKNIPLSPELEEYYNQMYNIKKLLSVYNSQDNDTKQRYLDRANIFYKNVVDRVSVKGIP